MQDVDRVNDIQPLSEPARTGRLGVDVETLGRVLRTERLHWIGGHGGRRRRIGQTSAVRAEELKIAFGPTKHLEAFLMDRAMVPATE